MNAVIWCDVCGYENKKRPRRIFESIKVVKSENIGRGTDMVILYGPLPKSSFSIFHHPSSLGKTNGVLSLFYYLAFVHG